MTVNEYIGSNSYRKAMNLPEEVVEEYKLLAQGEYNANYIFWHPIAKKNMVLRVNYGSQMHLDNQIMYEANAIRMLDKSGRTAQVYYVDGSANTPGNGIIVMEHLPGEWLDYYASEEMRAVAACLADVHSVRIDNASELIAPENSLKAILEECEEMVSVFMESDLAPQYKKLKIRQLLDAAWGLVRDDENGYRCCINTELNSTNFLVEKRTDGSSFARLVDWEKPLLGDPAQDLGHFLAPTTTFWKTDVILGESQVAGFIDEYISCVAGRFDTTGLRERTLAFIPVTCLRGITWCAMAWVQYQQASKELLNESTRLKLEDYLSDEYLSMIEKRVK